MRNHHILEKTTIKPKIPLDCYTKPMIQSKCTSVKTYHRLEVPIKEDGLKPIIFRAMDNMNNPNVSKEEDSKTSQGNLYSPQIVNAPQGWSKLDKSKRKASFEIIWHLIKIALWSLEMLYPKV